MTYDVNPNPREKYDFANTPVSFCFDTMNANNATIPASDTENIDAIIPAYSSETRFMEMKIPTPKDKIPMMIVGFMGFEIFSGTVSGVSINEKSLVNYVDKFIECCALFPLHFQLILRDIIFDVNFTPKKSTNPKFGINM